MFKAKTLLLIISILHLIATILLTIAAILSGIVGDLDETLINTFCAMMWLIFGAIWFDMYLKCEK